MLAFQLLMLLLLSIIIIIIIIIFLYNYLFFNFILFFSLIIFTSEVSSNDFWCVNVPICCQPPAQMYCNMAGVWPKINNNLLSATRPTHTHTHCQTGVVMTTKVGQANAHLAAAKVSAQEIRWKLEMSNFSLHKTEVNDFRNNMWEV